MRWLLCFFCFLLFACEGRVSGGSDAPPPSMFDGGGVRLLPGEDAGTDPMVDAGATDADRPDPPRVDAGSSSACASTSCGAGAMCEEATGACVCVPGFVQQGGGCVAPPPGDPAGRTATEVCAAWEDGQRMDAAQSWTPGDMMCDAGTMSSAAIMDALRRLNAYRWLVGVGPATDAPELHRGQIECAMMMGTTGRLSHSPTAMSHQCYTEAGAAAAGRSNIGYGIGSAAAAMDLYVSDRNVASLGHRRWVLNPSLGRVGIGYANRGDCLAVFDWSGSADRSWVAWPNPGPTPVALTNVRWSWHGDLSGMSEATVAVTRVSDGVDMPVTSAVLSGGGFGRSSAIGIDRTGWSPEAGQSYRVTITTPSDSLSYVVSPTTCS